jgi:hypothetical protein
MSNLNFVLSEFETGTARDYQTMMELYPQRPLIQAIAENRYAEGNQLMTTRPIADGLAIGRKLPVNCNVLAKPNTKGLKKGTLAQVLPYLDSNLEGEVPSYLNTACLPFL